MAVNNPNPQSTRQLGTGFTNLQNIMQANTGNQLGQAVSSGIQQTGQQASNALNSGVQNFNTQSQQNALGTQAQKEDVQNTLNNVANVTPTNVSNFQNYMSGQYNGPTDISNIANIQNEASNAQQQGQEVGTAGGRQQLLQQYASNPASSYNSGQQNLDSILLGASGGQQLQQARQAVSGLNNQATNAETTAQQQAAQLQNQAQEFGQNVKNQVQTGISNIYNPAQAQAQQANVTNQNAYNAEQAAVANAQTNNQLSSQALQSLGLTAGQRTYGVNPGAYLGYQQPSQQATALNVMAQPQFQQYSGLQQLMGNTAPQAQAAYTPGQATYNQQGLQQAMATAQAPLTSAQTAYQNSQTALDKIGYSPIPDIGPAYIAPNGQFITPAQYQAMVQNTLDLKQQYNLLNNQLAGTVSQTPSS